MYLNKRSKYIVRHHFIREAISNKLVKVEYLPSTDMPVDILTKGLNSEKYYKFLNMLDKYYAAFKIVGVLEYDLNMLHTL